MELIFFETDDEKREKERQAESAALTAKCEAEELARKRRLAKANAILAGHAVEAASGFADRNSLDALDRDLRGVRGDE